MRLTNDIRQIIARELAQRALKGRYAALKERSAELGDRVYRCVISEEVEKLADKLEKIHPGMVCQLSLVPVKTEAGRVYLRVTGNRPSPYSAFEAGDLVPVELLAEITDWKRDQMKLDDDESEACRVALGTLESFYNVAKLRQGWPEVMPIAEPILLNFGMQPKANLPAIDKANLNSMFGLPVEAETAEEAA